MRCSFFQRAFRLPACLSSQFVLCTHLLHLRHVQLGTDMDILFGGSDQCQAHKKGGKAKRKKKRRRRAQGIDLRAIFNSQHACLQHSRLFFVCFFFSETKGHVHPSPHCCPWFHCWDHIIITIIINKKKKGTRVTRRPTTLPECRWKPKGGRRLHVNRAIETRFVIHPVFVVHPFPSFS